MPEQIIPDSTLDVHIRRVKRGLFGGVVQYDNFDNSEEYQDYTKNVSLFNDGFAQYLRDVGKAQEAENLEKAHIEAQGHLFKVSVPRLPVDNAGGGPRGQVRGMSYASRKRLMEQMARLNPEQVPGFRHVGIFITLTYSGSEWLLPHPTEVKRHLDIFLKRLKRRFPAASGVWRFEWTSEGKRQYHPHLHLIVFGVGFLHHSEVRRMWNEVTDQPLEAPTEQVTAIKSWKGIVSYVSKYIAKAETSGQGQPVSAWAPADAGQNAISGGLAFSKVYPVGHPWLVYGAYLTGRVWGVFGRAFLPYGSKMEISANLGSPAWFYSLRRAARRAWKGVNRSRRAGFTLFCPDPGEWVRLSEYFIDLNKETGQA